MIRQDGNNLTGNEFVLYIEDRHHCHTSVLHDLLIQHENGVRPDYWFDTDVFYLAIALESKLAFQLDVIVVREAMLAQLGRRLRPTVLLKILGCCDNHPAPYEHINQLQVVSGNRLWLNTDVVSLLNRIAKPVMLAQVDLQIWVLSAEFAKVASEKRY